GATKWHQPSVQQGVAAARKRNSEPPERATAPRRGPRERPNGQELEGIGRADGGVPWRDGAKRAELSRGPHHAGQTPSRAAPSGMPPGERRSPSGRGPAATHQQPQAAAGEAARSPRTASGAAAQEPQATAGTAAR